METDAHQKQKPRLASRLEGEGKRARRPRATLLGGGGLGGGSGSGFAAGLLLGGCAQHQPQSEPLFSSSFLTTGDFTGGIEGPACDRDGTLYCVCYREARNIGRVQPDGTADLFVALPPQSSGNGIRFNPAGTMFVADYTGAPVDGSARRDANCERLVVRGGGWYSRTFFARPAGRSREEPGFRSSTLGFRVVRELE